MDQEQDEEKYFLLKYSEDGDRPIMEYNLKAELSNKENEKFKEYIGNGLFTENDSKIIISADQSNDREKIREEFEKLAKADEFCFFLMRKSFYKIFLYESCLNDNQKEIDIIKDEVLFKNYYFIDKVGELFENEKLLEKEKVKEKCYDLVYKIFTNEKFDIGNIQREYEPPEINQKDEKELIQQFLNILVGKYCPSKRLYDPNEIFKSQTKKKWEELFQNIANQFIKMNVLPKEKATNLYLLSLDYEIKFIEVFINNEKYKEQFEAIKSQYKYRDKDNNKDNNDDKDIINDLFARNLFGTAEKDNKCKYFRYPIWYIIKLNYTEKKEKKNCEEYFKKLEGNIICKVGSKKSEKSLLCKSEPLLLEHVSDEFKQYFGFPKNSTIITFKYAIDDKNSFNCLIDECKEIDQSIKDKAKKFSNLIPNLIKERMEDHLSKKDFYGQIKTNESMVNKLHETMKNECKDIITSLKNKEILDHDKFEKYIIDDFFKHKSLTIDSKEETLPQKLIQLLDKPNITENKFPSYLKEVDLDLDLLFRVFCLKESFFREKVDDNNKINFLNNDFMEKVLKMIIEQNKKQNNINSLITINTYINEHILELFLLNKINEYALKINSQNEQINQSYISNKTETKDNIFKEELHNIISNISNEEKKSDDFKELIKYSKELCKRINYRNEGLLNLELELLKTENQDFLKDKQYLVNFFELIKENKNNVKTFKDKLTNLTKQEKKFILDLLRIYYFKNTSNQSHDINRIGDIIDLLSKNIELSMEGCSLYQQIIGDLIPLNIIKNDEGMFISGDNKEENERFFEINDNAGIVLGTLMYFAKMAISKTAVKTMIPKCNNSQYMLIQSIEKLLLKVISQRNAQILSDENVIIPYFSNAIKLIKTYNENMVEQEKKEPEKKELEKKELLKQFIAIAFLKVYFRAYYDILCELKDNSSYCLWASNQLSDNLDNLLSDDNKDYSEVNKIIEFYVLKLIRNEKCKSFRDFRNFNFNGNQMLWVSDLKFKGKYDTEFEYLFISEWEDSNRINKDEMIQSNTSNFLSIYESFLKESFEPLRKEAFRTSKFDSSIKELIENNNIEMYVDVIMNVILCNTWNNDYINKMEYVEFCSWSKHLIKSIAFKEEKIRSYLWLLSIYSEESQSYCYSKILNSLPKQDETISIIDLEIILISLKFVLVFIIKAINLNKVTKLYQPKQHDGGDDDNYKELLCNELIKFLAHSAQFYIDLKENAKCGELLEEYNEIRKLLRLNNINQIKLFMNFLYHRIKTNISNNENNLNNIIDKAIEEWPLQKPVIQKYYVHVEYKEERIRNLLLEERMTPEATDGSKCNIQDTNASPLRIPIFSLFYYEELPTWDHFKKTNSSYIKNNKDKYPYINFFLEEDKYDYYGKELSAKEIKEILKSDKEYKPKVIDNYYPFKYYGFISLDELSAYYSKSYVFAPKEEPNCNLGDLIEYDIDAIEKELSSIKYFVVERGTSKQNKK